MTLHLKTKQHLIDNIWAFRFEPSEPLQWTPGQYIRVELPHENPDAEGTKRWFTVSSAPYEHIVQITTRVTQSSFKQALSKLEPGDELPLLETPAGDFVWVEADQPKVFVAGGIGITPFHSMLKQRVHDGLPLDATLIYGGRTDDLPFKAELAAWAQHDSRLRIRYVVGEPLTAAKLTELLPPLQGLLVYTSGPESWVEALGPELIRRGLPEAGFKHDGFPNYTETTY